MPLYVTVSPHSQGEEDEGEQCEEVVEKERGGRQKEEEGEGGVRRRMRRRRRRRKRKKRRRSEESGHPVHVTPSPSFLLLDREPEDAWLLLLLLLR